MEYEDHKKWAKTAFKWAVTPIIVWTLYRHLWPVSELALHSWDILFKALIILGEVLICFALCLLGAMLPDTDIDSKARKVVYTVLFAIIAPFVVMNYCRTAAIIGLMAMLPGILPHRDKRGPHSTLVVMILLSPFLVVPMVATGKWGIQQLGVSYYVAAVAGHTSHILADRKKKKGAAKGKRINFIRRHVSLRAAIIYFVVIIPVMAWTIHKKGLSIGVLREFLICSVVYMLVVKLVSAIMQLISRIRKVPGTIITMHIIVIVVVVAWTIYRQGLYVTDTLRGIFICSAAYVIGLRLPKVDLKQSWQKDIYSVLIPVVSILVLLGYYESAAFIGLIAMLPNIRKHSEKAYGDKAHWLAILLPLPVLSMPILAGAGWGLQHLGVSYYAAAACGYMTHIYFDKTKGQNKKGTGKN